MDGTDRRSSDARVLSSEDASDRAAVGSRAGQSRTVADAALRVSVAHGLHPDRRVKGPPRDRHPGTVSETGTRKLRPAQPLCAVS